MKKARDTIGTAAVKLVERERKRKGVIRDAEFRELVDDVIDGVAGRATMQALLPLMAIKDIAVKAADDAYALSIYDRVQLGRAVLKALGIKP